MRLPDFIAANKEQLIERWKKSAVDRLRLKLEESALVNDLPDFIDDVVSTLRNRCQQWPSSESAQSHGRQRVQSGTDIGTLTEEMVLLGEVIVELARDQGIVLSGDDVTLLMRVLGRGAAASVTTYATVRDKQVAEQAARHFMFVAHEIRTPLHTARLTSELLATCPDRDREKYAQRLERSLTQLNELVDNFLIDARLSNGAKLQAERVTARTLVERACEDVELQAAVRGLSLFKEADDFSLDADRRLMFSALTNLLRNAVKFSRDGGKVVVRAKQVDDRAVFEVQDSCGGMPEDLPSKLFQPFVQGGADRSGHGLGLMIVKQAVEAHGGAVRVGNIPGEGCCFALDVPCRQT